MASLGWPELLLIGLVIVLLFGTRRLPNAARTLGQALREFKAAAETADSDSADTKVSANEPPLMVFISSRIGEFAEERQEIAKAIARIPLTRPWVFEQAPASSDPLVESYLHKVAECDIFIQVLGEDISEPVAAEYRAAQEAKKPCLLFMRDGDLRRSESLEDYLKQIDTKWAEFHNTEDLCEQVEAALVDELIKGYRRYRLSAQQVATLVAFGENLNDIFSTKQKLLDFDRILRGNPADADTQHAREAAESALRAQRQRLTDESISPAKASRKLWSEGGSMLRISPRGYASREEIYRKPEFDYLKEGITIQNPTKQVANVTVSLMDTITTL